ncbi:MAG: hypothetical protein KDA84_02735 [Planctomycetaceae bacterium]|nr:hypothetical protein [Planctomycetaceae bacterium]
MRFRLFGWILRWLPCPVCRAVRRGEMLRIEKPLEVRLDMDGAYFLCHRCGRQGRIDRKQIPSM